MLLWKDGRKVPLFDIWHLTIEAQGHYYSHVHRHQLNTTKMRPNSLDPFEEALKPPPGETPEAKEARLRQEEAAKTRSDQIDAAIHQEKLARKKKKVVRVSRITFKPVLIIKLRIKVKLLLLGQSESGLSRSNLGNCSKFN